MNALGAEAPDLVDAKKTYATHARSSFSFSAYGP